MSHPHATHTTLQSVDHYLSRSCGWLYDLLSHLQQYRPVVVCDHTENLDRFPLADIHCSSQRAWLQTRIDAVSRRISNASYPVFNHRVARRHNVELVHSHFGYIGWEDLALTRALQIPHVVSFYGADATQLPKQEPAWLERYQQLFDSKPQIVVEGPFFKKTLVELGCDADTIRVNHLGVPLRQIPFQERRPDANGRVRLLMAGTFREKKGLRYALQAFANVAQRYPWVDVMLIGDAAAKPGDQLEKHQLLEVIERFKLQDRVEMPGFVSPGRLRELSQQCQLFISPSVTAGDGDSEGGAPVTLIEMLAAGMPTISSWHCDIPEVVQHRKSGLLAKERDVDELTAHLSWMLDHVDDWPAMGHLARAHIEAEFDVVKQAKKLEAIYNELRQG